jgi:hypothetical protein|tara:strand:+ start:190 stop:498 length:309 start_codon:yes stop_codon:yes gene_type:complete
VKDEIRCPDCIGDDEQCESCRLTEVILDEVFGSNKDDFLRSAAMNGALSEIEQRLNGDVYDEEFEEFDDEPGDDIFPDDVDPPTGRMLAQAWFESLCELGVY